MITYYAAYLIAIVALAMMIVAMYRDFVSEIDRLSASIDRLLNRQRPKAWRNILAELDRNINSDGAIRPPKG